MRHPTRLALIAVGICIGTVAFAQPYPTGPVRIVVPLAPGGGVDVLIRLLAPKLSESWGQPVSVENHSGAGSSAGTSIVARSAKDGQTLLASSNAHVVSGVLRTNLPYDPLKDFVPVVPLTSQAYVLVVGRDSGIHTVAGLIAAAKARPGELKFTSAGIGSGTHLMAEKFNMQAGVKMVHFPTAGAGAANEEVMAGRVAYYFSAVTPALPHIREGKLIALAVSSGKRLSTLPELPTVSEAGVSGFDSTLWYGVWAPAGTPGTVVDKIAGDVRLALALPDVRERLAKLGAETLSMTPSEFARFVDSEVESAARVVAAAGIKPQ